MSPIVTMQQGTILTIAIRDFGSDTRALRSLSELGSTVPVQCNVGTLRPGAPSLQTSHLRLRTFYILHLETKFTFLKQWKQRKTHFEGFGGETSNQQRTECRCGVIHVAATDKCVSPGPGAGDLLTSCGGCGEAEAMSRSSPASLGRRDTGRMVQA